jgi:hypothetical protein
MFGAAINGAFGGGGGNSQSQFDMAGWKAQGGSLFDTKGMMEFSNNQNQQRSEDIYQQSNANAQTGRVSQSYATVTAPNIPMSDSYNAAASAPVFPPAAQEKAAAVFGSNAERQGSTNGFKQEIKERIISDIGSL